MKTLGKMIENNWYKSAWFNFWLLPFSPLVSFFVWYKRKRFLQKKSTPNKVPVVVVGNLNVGGTGKTPLITYLAERAMQLGLNPAIISRGYGGKSKEYPLLVTSDMPASLVGDEPKLLHNRLGCMVIVSPNRADAINMAECRGADIIFSDDGLQHYAMSREAEMVVVDGQRQFGNGWLLPVGPLREPISRLFSVDMVLVNGKDFVVRPERILHLQTNKPAKMESLKGREVDAVCGLGNPQRFYQSLEKLGAQVTEHSFPDHYNFKAQDLNFKDAKAVLVMTEKDAVKCQEFAQKNWWYLTVKAIPNRQAAARIDQLLLRLKKHHG